MDVGPPPPSSQYKMHPTLWDSATPLLLVFAVEGGETLYRLNVNELAKHCQIFEDLMSLPPATRKEGTYDNPIIIPGVTDKVFESLPNGADTFRYVILTNHRPWADSLGIINDEGPIAEDQLCNLLHLGDLWDSRSLIKFAILRLE
ncbi:hypothetical protein BKA70DRAFT_1241859 [Coprinopsis sp. MPI-PUGE-AT-0042]|nr:hypothetical protein BKA70DRAFT_1241859 [Coprinopsis sp. MPI-PUGE-AT-0042]